MLRLGIVSVGFVVLGLQDRTPLGIVIQMSCQRLAERSIREQRLEALDKTMAPKLPNAQPGTDLGIVDLMVTSGQHRLPHKMGQTGWKRISKRDRHGLDEDRIEIRVALDPFSLPAREKVSGLSRARIMPTSVCRYLADAG